MQMQNNFLSTALLRKEDLSKAFFSSITKVLGSYKNYLSLPS